MLSPDEGRRPMNGAIEVLDTVRDFVLPAHSRSGSLLSMPQGDFPLIPMLMHGERVNAEAGPSSQPMVSSAALPMQMASGPGVPQMLIQHRPVPGAYAFQQAPQHAVPHAAPPLSVPEPAPFVGAGGSPSTSAREVSGGREDLSMGPANVITRLRTLFQLLAEPGCKLDLPDSVVQLWVPEEGTSSLELDDAASILAPGVKKDKLSGFREYSKNYKFKYAPHPMGFPGRAFSQQAPQVTANVTQLTERDYTRLKGARHYGIKATLMLPIFDDEPARPHMARRRVCLAVLEVAGMNAHIDAPRLIQALASPLRVVRMSTVKSAEPNVHPCTNLVSKEDSNLFSSMTEVLCRAFSITHLQVWGAVGPEGPANEDMRNGNNYFLSCGTTPFQMRTFILEAYREHCAGIHIACNSQSFINKAYQEMVSYNYADIDSASGSDKIHLSKTLNFRICCSVVAIPVHLLASGHKYVVEVILPCSSHEMQAEVINGIMQVMTKMFEGNASVGHSLRQISGIKAGNAADVGTEEGEAEETGGRKLAGMNLIPLVVIQKYFLFNLKEAAKKIGICPTTLKRMCRHYGVKRWPCRKMKKVNRYIIKLKGSLSSVEGYVEGAAATITEVEGAAIAQEATPTAPAKTLALPAPSLRKRGSAPNAVGPALPSLPPHALLAPEAKRKAPEEPTPSVVAKRHSGISIKALCGEEAIRFEYVPGMSLPAVKEKVKEGFLELEGCNFALRYLDDENDWVSITNEEHLVECVYNSETRADALKRVIRLQVHTPGDRGKAKMAAVH